MYLLNPSTMSRMWHKVNILNGILLIGLGGRVFANGLGDLGSRHTKDFKIVLDSSLFNTQQYKIRIKGKVEQSWIMSSALSYISV